MRHDLRKIDALVAEHVMGWENNWDNPGRGGMWGIMDWIEEADGSRTPVRAADFSCYSDDMNTAWEVLETFESWSMKYDPEEKLVTVCVMYEGNRFYDQAPQVPLAICLTALRAHGIEVQNSEPKP